MTSYSKASGHFLLAAVLLGSLSACGGGGGGGTSDPVGVPVLNFTDPYPGDSTETLAVLGLDTSGTPGTTAQTGTFNQNSNRITGSDLAGDTNSSLTFSDLTGGGRVLFSTPNGQRFSRIFDNTGTGGSSLGVVGMVPRTTDVPGSNTVTYSGSSVVSIADSSGVYDLAGTASVTANFGTGNVDVTLGSLSGTQQVTGGATNAVSNVTTVSITGATISGAGFSGGAVSATGFNTSGTQSHEGSFFGNSGVQEAGGVVAVDGSTTDILGLYLTNRN